MVTEPERTNGPRRRISWKAVVGVVVTIVVIPAVVNIGSNHIDSFLDGRWGRFGSALGTAIGWDMAPLAVSMMIGASGCLWLYRWSLAAPPTTRPAQRQLALAPRGILDYQHQLKESSQRLAKLYARIGDALGQYGKRATRHGARFGKYLGNSRMMSVVADRCAADTNRLSAVLEDTYTEIVDESDRMFVAMTGLLDIDQPTPAALVVMKIVVSQGAGAIEAMENMKRAVQAVADLRVKQTINAACTRCTTAIDGTTTVIVDITSRASQVVRRIETATQQAPDTSGSSS